LNHFSWDPIYGVYAMMASFVLGGLLMLAWAVRSGAMKDDEAPKYRMLEDFDDDGAPPPAAARDGGFHDGKA
jgi:nitrogen fixation-related uncharacterized protein